MKLSLVQQLKLSSFNSYLSRLIKILIFRNKLKILKLTIVFLIFNIIISTVNSLNPILWSIQNEM